MSRSERLGTFATLLTIGALALVMLAMPRRHDAAAIAACTLPVPPPGQPFLRESRIIDDPSIDRMAAAEQFVCHELRRPDEIGGWKFQGIDAFRTVMPGLSTWQVNLRYTLGTYGTSSARYILIVVQDAATRDAVRSPGEKWTPFWLSSHPAMIAESEPDSNGTVISWSQDGLRFTAELISTDEGPEVPLRNFESFLRSVN